MKKALKRSLSLLLAIAIVFGSVYAGLGEVDFSGFLAVKAGAASTSDLIFTLSSDGAYYSVTDCNTTASGELVIPETYNGLLVTSIGNEAFYNCYNLTSITIPDSVTSIDRYAFSYCSSLTSITIPDSVTSIGCHAFDYTGYENDSNNWENNALYIGNHFIKVKTLLSGEYTIKNGTKTIADGAFSSCESLTSITIPDSVTSIGKEAFYNCYNLTSIIIPDSVTSIGEHAFSYCGNLTSITIPDSVTSIGKETFYGCSSLTSITIPDSVTSIGEHAFSYCGNLTSITIPDSVTSIGNEAFYCCESLTFITIPDSVTSIGYYAFDNTRYYNDSSNWENDVLYIENHLIEAKTTLSGEYTIKVGTKSIGSYAFYDCYNLTSITIPDSVTSIGSYAFFNCTSLMDVYITDLVAWCNIDFGSNHANPLYYATNLYLNNKLVADLVIPDSVTSIGDYAFYNCSNLTSITIPYSVTSIGDYAFYKCNFTSITIPNSVISIGERTFCNCSNLTSIIIPDSVTSIGAGAFEGCTSLVNVYISDLVAWCNIDFGTSIANPLYHATNLYLNNELVTDLIIPYNVTSIGVYAFYNCSNLTSITIPDSVTRISSYAFSGCTNITDVYYCGKEADWENITIASGNNYIKDATIHYCEHTYSGDWIVDAEPTCTAAGSKHDTCTTCGKLVTKEIPITHNYSTEWTIDVAPTCTEDGSKSHHCLACDDKVDFTVVTAIGHNFEITDTLSTHPLTIKYKCTSCETTKTEKTIVSDCVECNFTITPIDSNTYKLVSYIGENTVVEIPTEYNGKAITTIANSCFKGNTEITSVEIEEGVTTIGSLAFMNCISLQEVVIPTSVTSIGANAFYNFNGKIYCEYGSVAHIYAIENNIDCIVEAEEPLKQTDYTTIDNDNHVIYTSVYGATDISDVLGVSRTAVIISTASYVYGNLELLGTGSIITVFDGKEFVGEYTLVVEGDINGDGVCDVLDSAVVALVYSGKKELTGAYALAADSNQDDIIDISDYQDIVNKAVS